MTSPFIFAQSSNDAAAGAAAALGGLAIFSLVCFLIGAILAITWIIFPFVVLSRLNSMQRISQQILQELRATREQNAESIKLPQPATTAKTDDSSYRPRESPPPVPQTGASTFGDNPGISR